MAKVAWQGVLDSVIQNINVIIKGRVTTCQGPEIFHFTDEPSFTSQKGVSTRESKEKVSAKPPPQIMI